jgi:hypothetical protein
VIGESFNFQYLINKIYKIVIKQLQNYFFASLNIIFNKNDSKELSQIFKTKEYDVRMKQIYLLLIKKMIDMSHL